MQQLGAAAAAAADRSRSFSLPHSALSHSHLTPRSLPATRASPISLMHHSSNQRRALFAGLPPREQALQAQRRNLEAFVQEHAEAYAALPYEPFTRVNPKLKFSVATKVAPSSLSGCRGLHGVILQEIVDTRDEPRGGRSLCYYPGLLVTERLYNIFSRKYHCPTALEIPALTYREPGDDEDKPMLIIGDPTSHGAIINDGVRSKVEANCKLQSVKAKDLKDILRFNKKTGKHSVDAQIGAVFALPGQVLHPGEELLLDYGSSFWKFDDDSHCVVCFNRLPGSGNPLVLCNNTECTQGRHRMCFPISSMPTMEDLASPCVSYYCPEHLAESYSTNAHSPQRGRMQLSLHATPPPHFAAASAAAASPEPVADLSSGVVDLVCTSTPPPQMMLADFIATPSAAARVNAPPSAVRSINFNAPPHAPPPVNAFAAHRLAASAAAPASASCSDHSVIDMCASPISYSAAHVDTADPEWEYASSESDGWYEEDYGRVESDSSASSDGDEYDSDGYADLASSRRRTVALPQEAQVDLDDALLATAVKSTKPWAEMSIRHPTSKQSAAKLAEYRAQSGNIGPDQLALLNAALDYYLRTRAPTSDGKWWFIPKSRGADAVTEHQGGSSRASAAATEIVDAAAGPSSAASAAGDAGQSCASTKSAITTQRWRSLDESLEHDWAEFSSCCGDRASSAFSFANLPLEASRKHCSRNIVNFFKERLAFRAESLTLGAHKLRVRKMLRDHLMSRVPWPAGTMCLSCFRALLGVSRGWMFTTVNMLDDSEKLRFPKFTTHQQIKKPRDCSKRDRVVTLLRAYAYSWGHDRPNPKGKDQTVIHKYLSVKRQQELADALSDQEQINLHLPKPIPVPLHLLRSARKWLHKHENLRITLGTSIQLMRCSTCDELDNRMKTQFIISNGLSLEEQKLDKYYKKCHLWTMQKQRDQFGGEKKMSMEHPEKSWTIMLDGMDQAKTQLPHRQRLSKALDPLDRMTVHVEGAFCFGGPQPVLGLLNFPDMRKDPNMCVAAVDRILSVQWEALEADAAARKASRAAALAMQRAEAAALNDPIVDQEMRDADQAARTVGADEKYHEDEMGHHWPTRLHLTFDNAAGECKNQTMFRYLGLLVLHGVFHQITVSTLLVGHTHDIVDQLFSIWARMLRVTDAETYEKMRAIFREKYTTRIEGLVNIMKKRKAAAARNHPRSANEPAAAAPAAARASGSDVNDKDEEAFDQMLEDSAARTQLSMDSSEILSNFTDFVKSTFKGSELQPHIELQTQAIDVQGWLKQAIAPGNELPKLTHLANPHNFGIEKDEKGNVYLYNKFLCDSENVKQSGDQAVHHEYLNQPTGSWTTRALLYSAGDKQLADPYIIPPLVVDTAKLRKTAALYHAAHAMTHGELAEFEDMLKKLDDAQKRQRGHCPECARLAAAWSNHGSIHRHKGSTTVDEKASNEKARAKAASWDAMLAHLYDGAYKDVHNATQVLTGWWTKWPKRVHEHINPAYRLRGLVLDPVVEQSQFHAHPVYLCSGDGEKQVVEPLGPRVDVSWLQQHGIPRKGQMAIIRGSAPKEAFYVVEVFKVEGLDNAAKAEILRVEAAEATESALQASIDAAAAQEVAAAGVAASAAAAGAAGAAIASAPHGSGAKRKSGALLRKQLASAPAAFSLKSLKIQVIYWDLHENDYATMRLAEKPANKKFWDKMCVENGTTFAELERQLQEPAEGKSGARPPWLVQKYKLCSFISTEKVFVDQRQVTRSTEEQFLAQDAANKEPISGGVFVVWGELTELFNQRRVVHYSRMGRSWQPKISENIKTGKLSIFDAVFKDLTQDWQQAADAPAGAAAAAAVVADAADAPADLDDAAAADADENMADVEEERKSVSPPRRAAARTRGTPSKRPRLVRQDDSDAESDVEDQKDSEFEQSEHEHSDVDEDMDRAEEVEEEQAPRRKNRARRARAPGAEAARSPAAAGTNTTPRASRRNTHVHAVRSHEPSAPRGRGGRKVPRSD